VLIWVGCACVYMFIGVNARTYMSICVYIVFKKETGGMDEILPREPMRTGSRQKNLLYRLVCASRPSRYVSVINNNHLVSLMNFIATKVNCGPYIKIHQ
jgi:hypothetical protein